MGRDRVRILGIVKALTSFGNIVEEAMNNGNFDRVLLSITDEEVKGLRDFLKHPIEVEMDDVEIIYEFFMRRFGKTSIPPEAYIRAITEADKHEIRIAGIDIPSGIYEDFFVENVKLSDMIFLSLRKRRLMKRHWTDENPVLFSLEWDRYLSKGGYLEIEKERAKYMASEIMKMKGENTLVIVEVERFQDIINDLNSLLQGYRFQENWEEMKVASLSRPS